MQPCVSNAWKLAPLFTSSLSVLEWILAMRPTAVTDYGNDAINYWQLWMRSIMLFRNVKRNREELEWRRTCNLYFITRRWYGPVCKHWQIYWSNASRANWKDICFSEAVYLKTRLTDTNRLSTITKISENTKLWVVSNVKFLGFYKWPISYYLWHTSCWSDIYPFTRV